MGRRAARPGGPELTGPAPAPHWAERLARAELEARGLVTLDANVRSRGGELDLVMQDGRAVVFVEVRQRTRGGFGGAAESLGARKQAKVRRAAERWLARHGRHEDSVRFDAFLVDGDEPAPTVRHVRDAF
ncbi:MAG: YraN family protein [Trueperaceae bacterium]